MLLDAIFSSPLLSFFPILPLFSTTTLAAVLIADVDMLLAIASPRH